MSPRLFTALAVCVVVSAMTTRSLAASQYLALNFSSLPSAQGWTYVTSGAHAGAVESGIFSVGGGLLDQNSIGKGYGVSGGGILYQVSGIVTTTEVKQLRFTARCLQVEGSGIGAAGQQGCAFGFTVANVQYDISITPTQVYTLGPGGTVLVPGAYDNSSAFHDYILDYQPGPVVRIYRDNVLLYTSATGSAVAGNRVFFGDGTGGANAHVEIKTLSFLQGGVVATEPATLGGVKSLYR